MLKIFFTVFISIFLAELGDKTQLATLLFASNNSINRWVVFLAASLALICATGLGVFFGEILSKFVDQKHLTYITATGFIAIGIFLFIHN